MPSYAPGYAPDGVGETNGDATVRGLNDKIVMHAQNHAHQTPAFRSCSPPLAVLAVLAVLAGLAGLAGAPILAVPSSTAAAYTL
jgi:hypothetical protein